MPVLRTIRNHKYQVISESDFDIMVIDKSTGEQLRFTKISIDDEAKLNAMFPEIPVLKYKKNGYYFLDIKIPTQDMSIEIKLNDAFRAIKDQILKIYKIDRKLTKDEEAHLKALISLEKKTPNYVGRISHTNLKNPAFEGYLKSRDLNEAFLEISAIRDSLPREFQADIHGKRLRKSKVITDGKNIKI